MRNQQKLSVAIIGAGIGGLALAAALRRYFIEPTVYERAERLDPVSGGVHQTPNAMKVHRWLGIEDRIRQAAHGPESWLSRDAMLGKVINDHPLGREAEARYRAPYLTLRRGDLRAALLSLVPPQSIRLGKALVGIATHGERVGLRFADGSEIEADAVIGADGAHSLVREHVAGPAQPRFTGRVAYRTSFPTSLLKTGDIAPSITKWWGRDRHIVVSYVSAGRDVIAFTTSQPEKADWATRETPSTKSDLNDLRTAFMSFHSDVQRLIAAAPEAHKSAIYDCDPLPGWSKGPVVLLGDACHPMTPSMASGAAMALEDAAVLARSIDEAETLEAAFRLYETTRKPRANMVQVMSSENTWMRAKTDPDWLFGYDATSVPIRSKLAADASTYYES